MTKSVEEKTCDLLRKYYVEKYEFTEVIRFEVDGSFAEIFDDLNYIRHVDFNPDIEELEKIENYYIAYFLYNESDKQEDKNELRKAVVNYLTEDESKREFQ